MSQRAASKQPASAPAPASMDVDGEPEIDADANGDDGSDDGEPEEEYEVRDILDHRPLGNGKYEYLISWVGYGPEHNTWEHESNVEHAGDVVQRYWNKVPKTEPAVKKRGRPASSSQAAPASSSSRTKQPRGTRANGAAKAQPVDAVDNDDADAGAERAEFPSTHVDSVDKYEGVKDWEKLVASIETVERGEDGKLVVYMTMVGGEKVANSTEVVNRRCPQKMLAFYENHLKWSIV